MNYKATKIWQRMQSSSFFVFLCVVSIIQPIPARARDLWREKVSLSLNPQLFSSAGWKAILLVDWRMMLLLREAEGARGDPARASSPGCSRSDGWAVKRPIVQITQQALCHRQGLIYSGTPPSQRPDVSHCV